MANPVMGVTSALDVTEELVTVQEHVFHVQGFMSRLDPEPVNAPSLRYQVSEVNSEVLVVAGDWRSVLAGAAAPSQRDIDSFHDHIEYLHTKLNDLETAIWGAYWTAEALSALQAGGEILKKFGEWAFLPHSHTANGVIDKPSPNQLPNVIPKAPPGNKTPTPGGKPPPGMPPGGHPFVTLSPQAWDRAQIALRDQGGGPGGPPGESGRPVLPGSNPMGILMGRSPTPRFDFGPAPTLGRRIGDTPWVAPKAKPFGLTVQPNPPTPRPGRRGDTGPNPAPQKRPGGSGVAPAPNPPADRSTDRSTDSKSASIERRSDPKAATETKTATPATDQKAPPPTEGNSGGGTTGGGGTSTDSKDDQKSPEKSLWAGPDRPDDPTSGMPNPEDEGSGGPGGPRGNPNPEDRFGAGDDGFERPALGDRVFDPKLFRYRVPGALGDMPSDEGGGGSGGGIGGPRSYGGQNQNPNPEDQGAGGGGGPRSYGNSSRSSFGGPRSYDAYPDPESTGGGGPRGRYNARPNPEDAAGPRGPSARNRSAIGPWSASRNRML